MFPCFVCVLVCDAVVFVLGLGDFFFFFFGCLLLVRVYCVCCCCLVFSCLRVFLFGLCLFLIFVCFACSGGVCVFDLCVTVM